MIDKIITIDYKYLDKFCNDILNLNKSLRWAGLTNELGVQLAEKYREQLKPLLTKEENEEYSSHTIARHKRRIKFEHKIGELDYALVKYEKVIRAIIPISNNYYLLITLDVEENDFDGLIMEKVIPFIQSERYKFYDKDGDLTKR